MGDKKTIKINQTLAWWNDFVWKKMNMIWIMKVKIACFSSISVSKNSMHERCQAQFLLITKNTCWRVISCKLFFCKHLVSLFLNNVYYEVVMVRGVVRWHVSVPSAAVAWAVEGSPPSPPIGSPAWPMLPSYWSSHRLTLPLFRGNLASQDSRGIRRGSELN